MPVFKRRVEVSPQGALALRRLLEDLTYELIPLKNVLDQATHLPQGARVSVTASPTKGMQATIDLSLELQELGFDVVPHISARLVQSMKELESILAQMDDAGIGKAFVVGGDADPPGDFFDGLAVLQAMDRIGHRLTVGIPGYPEGHNFIQDEAIDQALVDKQPFASYITTQMCFAPRDIEAWIGRERLRGIRMPVSIGIPGVAELRRLIAISARIGVGESARFLSKNTKLVGNLVRPGGYGPDSLITGLADRVLVDPAANVTSFHCYTFNAVDTTEEWRRNMLETLG